MFSKENKKNKKKKKVVNKTCKIVVPPSIDQIDRNFSRRIRLEGVISIVSPDEIYGICVTCNRVKLIIGELHCGHFMDRDNSKVRFDPRNCHNQCVHCNTFKGGKQAEYRIFMVRKYGEAVTQEIEAMARLGYYKIPDDELIKINKESLKIINKICKEKNINKWW